MQKKKPDYSLQDTESRHADSSSDELPGFEADTQSLAGRPKVRPGKHPQRIRNYVLEEVLGQGGMGTVYRARQVEPIKREVALKVIKLGRDSEKIIARFNAERQAMALMNHPYIAKVLDAGLTETEAPFFVMELIDGEPIVDFCDRHNFDIDARLRLFAKVCRGMEHAHQRGIIHRDLKPSNILVTEVEGEAIPKIIDFGLAKATENIEPIAQTELTELGQVLGTVHYMSPEQAELGVLDLDTRTDVYSLGVILFELLTGSTPLDTETVKSRSLLELLEYIRGQEPIRPSDRIRAEQRSEGLSKPKTTLNRRQSVMGELDWIVVKALERERERRYGSATQLADDIDRFLNHEPILAKPPSVSYRLQKFGRRYRTPLIVLATLFAIMLFGTTFSTYWAIRANTLAKEASTLAIEASTFAKEANTAAKESRLQSLYSQAESALNKGRYRDAFQFSSTAIEEGGGWEFGYQLKRIGNEVLKKRRLLASIPVDNEPLWVRFLTKDRIIFQTPSTTGEGYEVVCYDISRPEVLSRRTVAAEWKHPAICGENFITAAVGDQVKLTDSVTLTEIASRRLSGNALEMKVSHRGNRIAVLTEDGIARVFDTKALEIIDERQLKFDGNRRHFLISAHGKKIILKTDFNRHLLWDLETKQLSEQQIPSGHLVEFTGVENELFGITYQGTFASGFTLANIAWGPQGLEKYGRFRNVRGLNAVGQLRSIEVRKNAGIENLEVACFYEEHADFFSADDYLDGVNFRYADLFPSAAGETKLLGHSIDDSQLAVYADGKIRCVEIRRSAGWNVELASDQNVLADRNMPPYKMFNQHQLFWFGDAYRLNRLDIKTKETWATNLESFSGTNQLAWSVRFARPSSDGKKFAALWQESDYGNASSQYFNRRITVHDLENAIDDKTTEIEMQFEADFLEYSQTISWADFAFAAENKILVVTSLAADQSFRVDLLDIESGSLILTFDGNDAVTVSPSRKLFACSSRNKVDVRSTTDGRILNSLTHDGIATSIAFGPDDTNLYVGTNQNVSIEFSLTKGRKNRTLSTEISPLVVFPNAKLYAGLKHEGRDFMGIPFGRLLLASLEDGQQIETLSPRFSRLSRLAMSEDGRSIIGLPFLIEPATVDQISQTLSEPLPRSVDWTQFHVDAWAVNDRAQRLSADALDALGTNEFESAAKELERFVFDSGDLGALVQLRDFYAICSDWRKALRIHQTTPGPLPKFQQYRLLMILFKLEKYSEYRKLRGTLLNNLNDQIPDREIHIRLIAACLLPLDDENKQGVERLAKRAKNCPKQWQRNKYADAVYRLNTYLPSLNSFEEANVDPNSFLLVSASFANKPTDQNRQALQAQHDRLEKAVEKFEANGRLNEYWHDDVYIYGCLWEAKRLLGLLDYPLAETE